MPRVHDIIIEKGYSNGRLVLSDRGHTPAAKSDFIVWSVKPGIEVTSIEGFQIKPGFPDIFVRPPASNGSAWTAQINPNTLDYTVCEYSIHWNGRFGRKTFDPKISVRPRKFNFRKWFFDFFFSFFGKKKE